MKFVDIKAPYETKKMIVYGSDGHKLVRHNIKVCQVSGNIYMDEPVYPSYCNYPRCELYLWFPICEAGVWMGGVAADEDAQRYIDGARRQGADSPETFISALDECVDKGVFIPSIMVEMADMLKPGSKEKYAASNAVIRQIRAEREAEKKAAREKEDADYVAQKNREAENAVTAAENILLNGGTLKNTKVEFYRSRYDSSSYSVVNYLMRKYSVKVPIRTQGWINDLLESVTVNGSHIDIRYWKSKNGKGSKVIFDYLYALADAVKEASHYESVA